MLHEFAESRRGREKSRRDNESSDTERTRRGVFGRADPPLSQPRAANRGVKRFHARLPRVRASSVRVAPIREGRRSMSSTIPFARAHTDVVCAGRVTRIRRRGWWPIILKNDARTWTWNPRLRIREEGDAENSQLSRSN